MFDTHVNLHSEVFGEDLADVLARARSAGVQRMISICDQLSNFDAVLAIAKNDPGIWCSVGIHPHHSKDYTHLTSDMLVERSADKDVVAIGETGLDFHYKYSPEDTQISVFKTHIKAAQVTGLPLIIHSRDADAEMGDILEAHYEETPFSMLLHCYTGGWALAERALKLGAYFSVSGIFTFKNATDVREVISRIPLERIILETDCPYLSPVPMRGRRNEPAHLPHIVAAVARERDLPVDKVAELTEVNALTFFSKVSYS